MFINTIARIVNLGNTDLPTMKNQAIIKDILISATRLEQLMYHSVRDVVGYFTHMVAGQITRININS